MEPAATAETAVVLKSRAKSPDRPLLAETALRNPITGIAGCCARDASGHAAVAPPSSAMNSRRFTAQCLRASHERIAHLGVAGARCGAGGRIDTFQLLEACPLLLPDFCTAAK